MIAFTVHPNPASCGADQPRKWENVNYRIQLCRYILNGTLFRIFFWLIGYNWRYLWCMPADYPD